MKDELPAVELYYMVQEWQQFVGARLEQIYHPEPMEFVLAFHSTQSGKHLLRLLFPKFAYVMKEKVEMPEPTGLCMSLRNFLKGARLASVMMLGFERIVKFQFEYKEHKYDLIVELIAPGNLILIENDKILLALVQQDWKDRSIKVNKPYAAPPQKKYDPQTITENEILLLQQESDTDVVRTLASKLGLGGKYAQETLARAQVGEDRRVLSEKDAKAVHTALHEIFHQSTQPRIIEDEKRDVVPFALFAYRHNKFTEFPTFNAALDSVLSPIVLTKKEEAVQKTKKTTQDKITAIIQMQQKYVEEMQAQIGDEKRKGELIYEHYTDIKQILDDLKTLRKTNTWQEIKQKYKDHPLLKEIKENEGKIFLDIP